MSNESIFPGYNPPALPQGIEGMQALNSAGTQQSFLSDLSPTPSFFNSPIETMGNGYDSFIDWGKGLFDGNSAPTTPAVNGGGSSLWGTGGMVGGVGSLLGGAGGIAQAVMAGKQAKLGRDIFGFQRDSYNENNRLQAQSLNRQMQDRQIADINQYGRAVYEARKGDAGQYLADNKITPRIL